MGEQARDDALDIAVHHGGRPVEGDRRHRRRRIAADAGQSEQPFLGIGEHAVMQRHHRLGAFMQIAGAGVVAQAGPGHQHVVQLGGGEIAHRRPAFEKLGEIGTDRGHRGLLQHHLGQPDMVGIGALAALFAPGEIARVPVVPGEQQLGQGGGRRTIEHRPTIA